MEQEREKKSELEETCASQRAQLEQCRAELAQAALEQQRREDAEKRNSETSQRLEQCQRTLQQARTDHEAQLEELTAKAAEARAREAARAKLFCFEFWRRG